MQQESKGKEARGEKKTQESKRKVPRMAPKYMYVDMCMKMQ